MTSNRRFKKNFRFSHPPIVLIIMEDTLHAVALSVLSSPVFLGIWDRAPSMEPAEIYRELSAKSSLATQDYLWDRYPADPLAAAAGIIRSAGEASVKILHYWQEDYPRMLREITRVFSASLSFCVIWRRKGRQCRRRPALSWR